MTATASDRRALVTLGMLACAGCAVTLTGQDSRDPAPSRAELEVTAQRLDAAFVDRDADRYLACFQPLHTALHRSMVARVRAVLGAGIGLQRHTSIERYWRLGRHAIALVASETMNPRQPERGSVREHTLWAAHRAGDAIRIVLSIEVDAGTLALLPESGDPLEPKRSIRCLACNYSIRTADDWLMVPNCGGRTGCLESFSFYSLGDDLAVDLSVHLSHEPSPPDPPRMLRTLLREIVGADADACVVEPWLPPMYTATTRPMYLDGARCTIDVADASIPRSELRLATYGRVGYLFVVRGEGGVIDANRDALDSLMRSFAVDDPTLDPDQVAARITQDRQAGELDGAAYTNRKYGVHFAGPPDWHGRMEGGQYAFDVTWRHPSGLGSIRLKAMLPPPGAERWTASAVDRMLENTCARARLRIERDDSWHDCDSGFSKSRRFDAVPDGAGSEPTPHPPWTLVRVAMDEDLLVVVEAQVRDESVVESLRHALLGLSRAR